MFTLEDATNPFLLLYQTVNTYAYPIPAWFLCLMLAGRIVDYVKSKSITTSFVLYIMTLVSNYSLFYAVFKDDASTSPEIVPNDLLVLIIWTPSITVHSFYWLHGIISSVTNYLLVVSLSTCVNTAPFVFLTLFHKGYVQQSYVLYVAAVFVLVLNVPLEQVWQMLRFRERSNGLTAEQSHQLRMIYLVASRLQHLSRRNPVLSLSEMNMVQLEKTREEYVEKLGDIDSRITQKRGSSITYAERHASKPQRCSLISDKCVVCLNNVPNVKLKPCMHICLCKECAFEAAPLTSPTLMDHSIDPDVQEWSATLPMEDDSKWTALEEQEDADRYHDMTQWQLRSHLVNCPICRGGVESAEFDASHIKSPAFNVLNESWMGVQRAFYELSAMVLNK